MTITTFRPNATDQTIGSLTVVGTGGAHGVTANAPADTASYITSDSFGSGVNLGMQDASITSTQRVAGVKVRALIFHNSADVGWREYVDVRLRGSVTGSTTTAKTLGTVSDTAVEQDTGYWTTDPTGAAWTDLGLDRTQVALAWRARAASPAITQLRVAEVYMDADVRTQLSVSSVTVTGNTVTSRPTVAAVVAADPDGDVQTRLQLRIYTAAQVAAPTFVAGTTAGVYTITITGAGTTVVVGKDLIDTVSYRAYVRVAKAWAGPEGALWWSDWVSSSAFTMALSPPPAPVLSVAAFTDIPSYRVVATVDAPLNLLSVDEASFEGGVGTWAADANEAAPSTSATNPKSGAQSMTMSSSAAGAMRAVRVGLPVRNGLTYTAVASFRAATAGRSVRVLIRWKNAAGTLISTVTGGSVTDTTTGYTQATASGAAPSTAATADLVTEVLATAAAAEVHRVDEAMLSAGTSTTWSNGGFRAGETVTVERGERVDSDAGPAANWAHPHVASGGTVEQNTDGFAAEDAADVLAWEPLAVAWPTPGGPAGVIHWEPRDVSTGSLRIGGLGPAGETDWLFPVVGGQTHILTSWLWAAASFACTFNLEYLDDDGSTVLSTATSGALTLTTTPTRRTATGAAPAGAAFARGTIVDTAASTTAEVFVTEIGFGTGTIPVDDRPAQGGPLVWNEVRRLGTEAPPVGERVLVVDYEPPPARPLLYRARTLSVTAAGDDTGSDYSLLATVLAAVPSRSLLIDPWQPDRSLRANITLGAEGSASSEDATELHGMGRDQDPVFLRAWVGRDRTYQITVQSWTDYASLEKILDSPRSLLILWSDGGRTYIRVTGWSRDRSLRALWRVNVQAAQTGLPA